MDRSVQVVVIGGGIIGTAITYYLAKRGADVVLLEEHTLASGTSGACSGAITMQTKGVGTKLKLAMESKRIYRDLSHELGEDLEYQEDGSMIVAETKGELEYLHDLHRKQQKAGLGTELLEGKAVRERQPALSAKVLAAIHCPTDGKVNPLKVTAGFAEAARKKGARLFRCTAATRVEASKGRVKAVVTDSGKIETEWVVNAAGIWAPRLAQQLGLEIPIRPRRGILIVSEAVHPFIHGSILSAKYLLAKYGPPPGGSQGISGGLSLRFTKRGNLLFGSTREFVGEKRNSTYAGIAFVAKEAVRILPIIKNLHFIRAFAGLRPATPDGLPILGPVEGLEGFVVAAGHEGDGISLSPITGQFIAGFIAQGRMPDSMSDLTLSRFEAVDPLSTESTG
jgi:sarcosine oxidase subunit beta